MTLEVFERQWSVFEKNLQKSTTVEQVMAYQNEFFLACIDQCLLSNGEFLVVASPS